MNHARLRRTLALPFLVWATIGTIRCNPITSSEPPAETTFQPGEGAVSYIMGSSWREVENDGWLTSDLGFNIRLDEVTLSVAALELVPCEPADEEVTLWDYLGPSRARALHPDLHDVSKIDPSLGVSLLDAGTVTLGEGQAGANAYCFVHLLAHPIDDPSLGGASLIIRGEWTHPDGRSGSFDGSMPLTFGRSLTLLPGADLAANEFPYVELQLHPATAFDGLVLEDLNDADLAWELLKQLVETTTATFYQPAQ